jgi:hypothetical protein
MPIAIRAGGGIHLSLFILQYDLTSDEKVLAVDIFSDYFAQLVVAPFGSEIVGVLEQVVDSAN